MEPDVLVGREEPGELGPDDTNDVAQHRDEDHGTVKSQDKTGTARGPDGESERVKASQSGIGLLDGRSVASSRMRWM